MPRPRKGVPAYRLHKGSGQAVCYIGRREHYLGPYDSPESRQRYAELLTQLAKGLSVEPAKPARSEPDAVTLGFVMLRYATEKLPTYSKAEQFCQSGAIRITRKLFGAVPVAEFGPLKLRVVRDAMLKAGWSPAFINRQVKRLRGMLRWGISFELVPPSVVDALACVESLPDPTAAERRRMAIPQADLEAVRAVLKGTVRDLYDLALLTGARPGELVGLTAAEIDRSGDVWRADLANHKTRHQGKTRVLFFNATAQQILSRSIKPRSKGPIFPIRRESFGRAVKAACLKAGVSPFTPHWLRHTVATRLADELGTESARRLLGHATKAMTEHYSRAAEKLAIDAAKRLS